jgi:hypothetical protein
MGFIIIKRGEKKPKKSYGRNIKKRKGTQIFFSKNHNGVYNKKEKTEKAKKP